MGTQEERGAPLSGREVRRSRLFGRQYEMKHRANIDLGLCPETAAVLFNYASGYRKPDSVARILASAMQSLKNLVNAVLISRVESDPVVGYGKRPPLFRQFGTNLNLRPMSLLMKLDCIPNQILKYLGEFGRVRFDYR
jgi:hypothetical protein